MTITDKLEAAILRFKRLRDDLELMPMLSQDEYNHRMQWVSKIVIDLESNLDGADNELLTDLSVKMFRQVPLLLAAKWEAESIGGMGSENFVTMLELGIEALLDAREMLRVE